MLKQENKKIFKAYDVRGIYPSQIDKKIAYLIGRAFVRKTKAKQVVIGRDMRKAAPIIKKAIIEGMKDEGVKKVIDIGLVPIDAVYFAVGILRYEAGVMVTASHNPAEYIGCKMVRKNSKGMEWIRGRDLLGLVEKLSQQKLVKPKTEFKIKKYNIYPKYIKHVLSFVDVKRTKPLKVVVDAGNGMAGKVVPILAKYLPIKVVPLNFKLDGDFPAHPSNPLEPESQVQITKKIKQVKANIGIIMDGDTDRLFFVDEKGKFIRADITLLLLAKLFLEKYPGKGVAYNLICSKIVPEKVKEWGGRPIRTEVGFVNVANGMMKNDGIIGGELAAHYSFRDNAYADSGFIALMILLELLSQDGRKLSDIVKPFYKYHKLPEINTPVDDIDAKLREIKKKYKKYKQDYLDGVTVDNWKKQGWWFNARPSNTEPLLRITMEAKQKEVLYKLRKDLGNLIKK